LAAALATLDIVEREAMANAEAVGNRLLARIGSWVGRYPAVGDVRGRGLMVGVEIVKDPESRVPDERRRDAIVSAAFERGLLLLGAGASTLRICPPLIITSAEADTAMDILEESIRATEAA
jgi:4-aminobutyrate aminotransferase